MKAQIENRKLRICLWLLDQLRTHSEGLSLSEINAAFVRNEELSGGHPLIKSTFQNYKNAIMDLFGIEILCSRSTLRYSIASTEAGALTQWLINSFSVGRLVREHREVRDRILFEPTPTGSELLSLVVEALRTRTALRLTYQKFADSQPYTAVVEPYALKLDNGRWYLLARKNGAPRLQSFAFDRCKALRLVEGRHFDFELPFDPHTYFAFSFGVFTTPKPESVRLRVYGETYNFLHTKPLHHTQQERLLSGSPETDLASCVWEFSYTICPSIDFRNELLRWGGGIEVVAPASFRESIKNALLSAVGRYE